MFPTIDRRFSPDWYTGKAPVAIFMPHNPTGRSLWVIPNVERVVSQGFRIIYPREAGLPGFVIDTGPTTKIILDQGPTDGYTLQVIEERK